ncbi:ABC transporter permease [Desulfosporosinus sp. BICA1-9]|uniref:ABC transporter permease n=1 Tax=Desulfosporosinus sp. BICA1-9 TaxID=1531958 RepID=UPI00054B682A|nr:ABC transporter permease [Desulfosporosinus sp. BICA1-9]KJS50491.1 MAG: peptide ABC transporter permease [Peptococcaceae bacterium BRH_c23]KJS90735.1 MAG: peptide ABC transporter permease [Desulfosporosinus sp. BICA1-9]HBW33969.1 ABC transporter permease [Desulfosporosinus sp.]
MSRIKFLAKWLSQLLIVLLGVTLVTFLVSHVVPGDPARMLIGQRADAQTLESMRHALGLDKPVWFQYLDYLWGLVQGDMGISIRTQRPVLSELLTYFPATIELTLFAMGFAVIIGVVLGLLSAAYRDTLIDHATRVFAILGVSTPLFWLGLVVLLLFYKYLGWLPGSGRIDSFINPPTHITGLYVLDSVLSGDWVALKSSMLHLVLPSICLGYIQLATIARQVRASMIEVLELDYIKTAVSNGIPRKRIIYRHALRNALIPTVTVIGLTFGELLGGAIITETIFAWPGMGKYVVDSISFLDFPAIMGFTILVALIYVLINMLVDLLYPILDPQIKG